jgi:hypothetical protein
MSKISIADLHGICLDWAAAIADGYESIDAADSPLLKRDGKTAALRSLRYSRNLRLAGRIIEREHIWIRQTDEWKSFPERMWRAEKPRTDLHFGPTPLIACMRCFVASRSKGASIEVPDELIRSAANSRIARQKMT